MERPPLLSGNEAIARGAWEAGVRLGAGYPGTPSTEILESLASDGGVSTEWSPNEKVRAGGCGGLVVVTADDPGMHSSQNEQDNRLGS